MTILEFFNTWAGRGVLGFLIAYLGVYLPYAKNHYDHSPTIEFQIFLLIVCLLLGKIAFWIALILAIINRDEWTISKK